MMIFGIPMSRHLEYVEVPRMSQSGVGSEFSVFEIINCRRSYKETEVLPSIIQRNGGIAVKYQMKKRWSWIASLAYLINIDILR